MEECKVKHHVLLHSWVNLKTDHAVTQSSVNCASTKGSVVKNCLGIIPVTVVGGNGNSCQTYALLDDGADKTLCDERLLKIMNLACRPVTFQMSTVSSTGSTIEGQEVDLHVRPIQGKDDITLRKVWSVKTLPISTQSAPNNSDFQNVPHLSDITIPQIDHSSVMLLIGTDSPEAHIPLEVRSGNNDEPYAIRTKLGWAVRGPVLSNTRTNTVNVNFEQSTEAEKILNDSLLTPVSCDPGDPLALTPNTNRCLPIGLFKKQDVYAKRCRKQVQYLLQKRKKWKRKTTYLRKDDVVLIATDNVPRGQCPLARVVDVKVGRDDCVWSKVSLPSWLGQTMFIRKFSVILESSG